jgi:hypothetical protein
MIGLRLEIETQKIQGVAMMKESTGLPRAA